MIVVVIVIVAVIAVVIVIVAVIVVVTVIVVTIYSILHSASRKEQCCRTFLLGDDGGEGEGQGGGGVRGWGLFLTLRYEIHFYFRVIDL